MSHLTDLRPVETDLYFLPVETRTPLKFGKEVVTRVACARVRLRTRDRRGREADGWGETPLSVTWVWPSSLSFEVRDQLLKEVCLELADAWAQFDSWGHAFEVGHAF